MSTDCCRGRLIHTADCEKNTRSTDAAYTADVLRPTTDAATWQHSRPASPGALALAALRTASTDAHTPEGK